MAGVIVADTLQDGAGNSTAMDNAIYGSAKAWVLYNSVAQTVTSSYNVSSITYNSTGNFTVNFTNALADANYALCGSFEGATGSNAIAPYASGGAGNTPTLKTSSACRVEAQAINATTNSVIFYR